MQINPTDKDVFTALRTFVLAVIPIASDRVVRGLGNGVPTPTGAYIALTENGSKALSTNTHTLDSLTQTTETTRPTQYEVWIDCYGPNAGDWAVMLTTLFRDPFGCDSFTTHLPGSAPLYCTDPKQAPLVTGEENYQKRWRFSALIQYNPVITTPQQSATVIDVTAVSIDADFPPSEVN